MLSREGAANVVRGEGEPVGKSCWAPDDDGVARGLAKTRELGRLRRHQVVKVKADLAEILNAKKLGLAMSIGGNCTLFYRSRSY